MATPTIPSKAGFKPNVALSQASPCTQAIGAPPIGSCSVIDSIIVSNSGGGAAEVAAVEIQRVSDSAVLWRAYAQKNGAAAPNLLGQFCPPGGLYKGLKDISLKVVVTMAGATAIHLCITSHDEVAEG